MAKPRVTKQQAEQAIFDRFVQAYSTHYGSRLVNPIHRDRPDFSAEDLDTRQTLGIEVTGVYQDAREAEINYWLSGDWGIIVGDIQGLVAKINRALQEKSDKAVQYENIGPLILAIWIGSFIFKTKTDIQFIQHELGVPKNPFSLVTLVISKDDYTAPVLHILEESPGWRNRESA
jgi:hypothetical protein